MSRPRFPRWSDLGQRPAVTARREQAAVHLALLLAAGTLQAGAFAGHINVIGQDAYERFDWLRAALAPLVPVSPTVRRVVRLLDIEGPRITWDEPAVLRRHLRRLAVEAERLGTAMRTRRRGRS